MNNYFEIIGTIIVAIIAAIAILWGYSLQRRNELKLKIAERKRAAYTEFLKDFTHTVIAIIHNLEVDEPEKDRQRILARNQLLLYASDDVIKKYNESMNYSDENPDKRGDETEVALFGEVLSEIRKDIFEGKTNLKIKEIENLNPFHRG